MGGACSSFGGDPLQRRFRTVEMDVRRYELTSFSPTLNF
jgi:hypothetical protein